MHTYDLVINHRTTRQTVEGIAKLLPHFDRKPASALIVEAIDSIDSSTFMVSSQQKEVFRIFNFVSKQQTDNFKRLLSTVNVVAQEQIVRLTTTETQHENGQPDDILLDCDLIFQVDNFTSGGNPPYSNSRNKSVYCP